MKRNLIATVTVLALCLSLLIPAVSALAETELPYWDKSVKIEGRTLTLTITSKNAAGLLGGGVVELKYDPEVLEFQNTSGNSLADSGDVCGAVNGLSYLNTFIANFASAKSFNEDRTLVIATFEIKEGKTCNGNPFTVVRDLIIDSGNGVNERPVKQVNIDNDGNTVTPDIKFSCNHKDSKVETIPATCIKEGSETITCNVCGKTETKVLEKIDHAYTVKVSEVPATCTVGGKIVWKCATCDKTKEEPLEALDHKWDDGVITKAPTCTEKGIKIITCTRCSETKTEDVAAAGHKPGEQVTEVEPTLTENGIARIRCTVCSEVIEEIVLPKLFKYGDVDANGVVDSNDAIMILRYNAGALEELTDSQKLAADVDGSETVDSNDAILILRFDAKNITNFPVEDKKAG